MAKDVIMPALGMAQETGTLLRWLKAEGDAVTRGEPLMEIETDKAVTEVEAPASGVLTNVTAHPGDEIPVGQVIAIIVGAGESIVDATRGAARSSSTAGASVPQSAGDGEDTLVRASAERIAGGEGLQDLAAQRGLERRGDTRVLASPKARRLALERGLPLSAISGSGPDGAVLTADVVGAMAMNAAPTATTSAPAMSSPAGILQKLTVGRIWRTAAERLTQSWTTVPHFFLMREAHAQQLIAWRRKLLARATEVTYTDLLVKIVAVALRRHPHLNASWHGGDVVLAEEINVGVAVATEAGLIVPVIHRADRLGVHEIAARRKELVGKARSENLSAPELTGGTFTVSNLGMYGVDAFTAIINPPQAAILAVSRIAERVVAVNGQPAVQPMITLTLSCDHRVVDGARGAQFLQTVAESLEEPLCLLD